jgi:hypothetical protein
MLSLFAELNSDPEIFACKSCDGAGRGYFPYLVITFVRNINVARCVYR